MFESSDDSEEESDPKPTLGELLGRPIEAEKRREMEARDWEEQQPTPLLMPREISTVAGEHSTDKSSPDICNM